MRPALEALALQARRLVMLLMTENKHPPPSRTICRVRSPFACLIDLFFVVLEKTLRVSHCHVGLRFSTVFTPRLIFVHATCTVIGYMYCGGLG